MNHTFHKVARRCFGSTHILWKMLNCEEGDRIKNETEALCDVVEWRPSDILCCRTHTVSRLESSNFFSLSLQRKKLLEKNPFYACYQRVAFGLYRLSSRKRQDEDGRRFVDVVKKEEVKSSRGEGRRRWKGWTEEDDSLWGEARTDRRRYFIFQRFFLTVSQQSSGTGNLLGSMQNFKNSSWVSKKCSHLTTAGSLLCCVALCRTGDENNSSCRILRCFSSLNNDFFFFQLKLPKKNCRSVSNVKSTSFPVKM